MKRRLALSMFIVLFSAPALADQEPMVIVLDWVEGSSTGAAGLGVEAQREWPIWVDACHRRLWADLLYEPSELGVDLGKSGAGVAYEFRVEVQAGDVLLGRNVTQPGFSYFLGETSDWGEATAVLRLEQGALVDWSLRLRGWEVPGDEACAPRLVLNEIEANPAGADAGNEWVELYNPGSFAVDAGGWSVESTHGVTHRHELPTGLMIPRGGYASILFPEQFLDNENESVRLLTPTLEVHDETPVRSDGANSGSSWQRVPDGSDAWAFRASTRDGTNGV